MPSRRLATVLFTDIVGSTERLTELGDVRWSALLDRHRRVVRAQIEHFGGHEVTTTGDGFLVVFEDPGRAIRCAMGPTLAGSAHLWAGDIGRARELFERTNQEQAWASLGYGYLAPEVAYVRSLSGDTSGAQEVIRKTESFARNLPSLGHDPGLLLIELAALKGDASMAAERLRSYMESGGRDARFIRLEPVFGRVRSDPEFLKVLAMLETRAEQDRRQVERLIEVGEWGGAVVRTLAS